MIRTRTRSILMRSLSPVRMVFAAAGVVLMVTVAATAAAAAAPNTGFGFNAPDVAGFPTGRVALTGGGAFHLASDPSANFVHSGGGFSCTADVAQGPLAGCLTGEGVRWDTAALLSDTTFKCTGSATEALKPASTGSDTVVLQADFYRAGDANDESFTANIIVSTTDIARDIDGIQNVWVQGVGCGAGPVSFGV